MANKFLEPFTEEPFRLFEKWLTEAEKSEPNDPNAMALATVDENGRPSVRMVLLKQFDARGFAFFTNLESAKARALTAHPSAELNFHWKSLRRQIRISGPVERTTDKEADEYFATRARLSQIGARASSQSRPLKSYESFEQKVHALEKEFEGKDIPRPAHWGGFRVKPERMEFWIGDVNRLHKRFVYVLENGQWQGSWLFP